MKPDFKYNMFLVFEDAKYVNCTVFKNANMQLGLINIRQKYDPTYYEKPATLWDKMVNTVFYTSYDINTKYNDYKKFIVYRDPFERLLSYYKYFYTRPLDNFSNKKFINEFLDAEEFIDRYYFLGENNIDFHCVNQRTLFEQFEPDIVVPINKLSKFIKEELKYTGDIIDVNKSIDIHQDILNDFIYHKDYFDSIYYYANDVNLLNEYKIYE